MLHTSLRVIVIVLALSSSVLHAQSHKRAASEQTHLIALAPEQDTALARWIRDGSCMTELDLLAQFPAATLIDKPISSAATSLTKTVAFYFEYAVNTSSRCVHTIKQYYCGQAIKGAYEQMTSHLTKLYGTPETEEVMDLVMSYRKSWTTAETKIQLYYAPGSSRLEVEYHHRKIR